MHPDTLAWWRNLAALLLMAEAFILTLPMVIALFFAVKGMRAVRAKLETVLPLVQERTVQVENGTRLASKALVIPPIRLRSAARGAASGVQTLVGRNR